MARSILTGWVALWAASLCWAQGDGPLLLRTPTVSRTQIAFSYAEDLWIVGRDGGEARRLTSAVGAETGPVFSPDGALIAFTGEYDGNTDVYVVAAAGGEPRRLTYHPGPDVALGFTRDGKQILFHSPRASHSYFHRLFTIPPRGRVAEQSAAASGRRSVVFTRWIAPRLRPRRAVAAGLEALPGRAGQAHLDRQPPGLERREAAARGLQSPTTSRASKSARRSRITASTSSPRPPAPTPSSTNSSAPCTCSTSRSAGSTRSTCG